MKQPADITYRDFYDFPRMFLVELDGTRYLFDGSFDDTIDDYAPAYTVYELPTLLPEATAGSWVGLAARARRVVGSIPTDLVRFDPTRRRQVDVAVLADLLRHRRAG